MYLESIVVKDTEECISLNIEKTGVYYGMSLINIQAARLCVFLILDNAF
jgi:hypothetical protein